MSQVKVGISSGALQGTYLARHPVHDPLEAVVCAFESGSTRVAMIGLDLVQLSVGFCTRVRRRVAQRCQLAPEAVITHCTHTHTSPGQNELLEDGLADCLAGLVNDAFCSAEPVRMAYRQVDTGRRYNVNRRRPMPRGLGSLTMWLGFDDHQGDPDGGPVNRARLEHWLGRPVGEPDFQGPMIYNGPTDGLLQAVFFQTLSGRPIGSIVRYSAHPCIAGHTAQRQYSADFPGVVRRRMAEAFGGTCCFLTGPCGNLAPWEQGRWPQPKFPENDLQTSVPWFPHQEANACHLEVRRIGDGLAETLIRERLEDAEFSAADDLKFSSEQVSLPLRNDLVANGDEALRRAAILKEEFLRIRHAESLSELKQLADKISFLEHHRAFYEEYHYLDSRSGEAQAVHVSTPLVRLNSLLLMGLPGEVFWQTAQSASQAARSRRMNLISFTEANGDIGYIPTESERSGGDYECNCCIVADGAEARLAGSARVMVQRI